MGIVLALQYDNIEDGDDVTSSASPSSSPERAFAEVRGDSVQSGITFLLHPASAGGGVLRHLRIVEFRALWVLLISINFVRVLSESFNCIMDGVSGASIIIAGRSYVLFNEQNVGNTYPSNRT